jgi:hypothetical protein
LAFLIKNALKSAECPTQNSRIAPIFDDYEQASGTRAALDALFSTVLHQIIPL